MRIHNKKVKIGCKLTTAATHKAVASAKADLAVEDPGDERGKEIIEEALSDDLTEDS